MSTYRREWACFGSVTETDAWEPEFCPFCVNAECAAPSAANGAEQEIEDPAEIAALIGPDVPYYTADQLRAAVLAERAALERIFSEILIDSQTSDEAQHKLDSAIRART